jgi:hypothetical protein
MTKLPSPSEIQTNKRLRLLCNELASINASVTDSEMKGCDDARNRLPARVVDAINALNADRADLMAIRQTPFKWHSQPYNWLWMLHRYQNHYQP